MPNVVLAILLATTLTEVTVRQVRDRRDGPYATLDVMMALPAIQSAEVEASRVLVSKAVDDTGRDLIFESAHVPFDGNSHFGPDRGPMLVTLYLKNPARTAKTLKEVRGEIELYMPSKDPDAIAEVPKFLSLAGKPLAHKALTANGVELALVTPAQLAAARKKLGEAKRKEWAGLGYEGEKLAEMVDAYVQGVLSVQEDNIVLRLKDPDDRIQDIAYVDRAGEVHRPSSHGEEGFRILSMCCEAPRPDWTLRVILRTPKNMVRYPFALKDVPLP